MTRPCSVCMSSYRDAIDKRLTQGDSLRDIASKYKISKSALQRHKSEGHLNMALVKSAPPAVLAENRTLQDQLRDLHLRTLSLLADAEEAGDVRTSLVAIREARSNLETLAKIELALLARNAPTVNAKTGEPLGVVFLPKNDRDPLVGMPDAEVEQQAVAILRKRGYTIAPPDGMGDEEFGPWVDELNRKINRQVEGHVSAILGGGPVDFEHQSRMGWHAFGEAMGVLRKMCAAAGITPESVKCLGPHLVQVQQVRRDDEQTKAKEDCSNGGSEEKTS